MTLDIDRLENILHGARGLPLGDALTYEQQDFIFQQLPLLLEKIAHQEIVDLVRQYHLGHHWNAGGGAFFWPDGGSLQVSGYSDREDLVDLRKWIERRKEGR